MPADDPAGVAARVAAEVPGAVLVALLKHDRYATTARVRLADGTPAVWKRSVVVLPPGVRVAAAARRLAQREADHLERLAGVPGIPRLLGRPTPDTFLRAWIDGTTLRECTCVPDPTFPALRALLAEVHARGVAYADLAKEENVIVDEAGGAWLVDFQISAARHVRRRRPDQLTDADRAALARGKGVLSRLHRALVKTPYNVVTRRWVKRWSGAGEGRREGEPRGLRDA